MDQRLLFLFLANTIVLILAVIIAVRWSRKNAQRAKAIMIRKISHDLRSPLSALNLLIGSLKDLPEAKKNLLTEVANRLGEMANDLQRSADDSDPP